MPVVCTSFYGIGVSPDLPLDTERGKTVAAEAVVDQMLPVIKRR